MNSPLKTVGVKELKNRLSAYLREVKQGTRVFVTDRNVVVAELRSPSLAPLPEVRNPILAGWVNEGAVRPPLSRRTALPTSPLKSSSGAGRRLLDLEREES
ncbi:MAG: type II toxin-antitoxin system Phd/YefM family antitoxin [Acidobacteriota bacterium]